MPEAPLLARAALHRWEEPPLSGTRGAGAIFFTGCSLGCVYCQNTAISRENFGVPVTVERLAAICDGLIAQGAHNIDFVTPTHYAHVIARLLEGHPLPVPAVWNSSGYERVETLRALEGRIGIYLPDFKYPDAAGAARYSDAPDYPEIARAAIREMVRQTGPVRLDGEGILQRGVIIRHLLLPGRVREAKLVMDWVAQTFPKGTVLFSLMSQYVPWGRAGEYAELARPVRPGEARAAREYMENLGLDGFWQELDSARRDYTPAFDLTGI